MELLAIREGALVHFLSCYPSIIGRAAPSSSVASGFIYNGMIDGKSYHWPDYNKILGTCKNNESIVKDDDTIKTFTFNVGNHSHFFATVNFGVVANDL